MKTAGDKTLGLGLLLILVVATGCSQQVEPSVESASGAATMSEGGLDQAIDTDELAGSEQKSVQPATGEPVSVSQEEKGSVAIASSPQDSTAQPQSTDTSPQDMSAKVDEETASAAQGDSPAIAKQEDDALVEPTIDIPATWTRLSKTQEVWVDTKNKQVIVGGKVCLDAGQLEMIICPRNTKEHESIVSVNAESWQVHAALQAVGANPGVPCRWVPEYTSAWGPKIEIQMMWWDKKTKQVKTIDAKQWVLNSDTRKPMTTELVFGGSYSEPRLEGDQPRYVANDGELICLANFSTSTIDLRVSEDNIDIFFEANTPLIPPLNTQVYTVITPGPVVGKPEE